LLSEALRLRRVGVLIPTCSALAEGASSACL
jgi:hypothetical protein